MRRTVCTRGTGVCYMTSPAVWTSFRITNSFFSYVQITIASLYLHHYTFTHSPPQPLSNSLVLLHTIILLQAVTQKRYVHTYRHRDRHRHYNNDSNWCDIGDQWSNTMGTLSKCRLVWTNPNNWTDSQFKVSSRTDDWWCTRNDTFIILHNKWHDVHDDPGQCWTWWWIWSQCDIRFTTGLRSQPPGCTFVPPSVDEHLSHYCAGPSTTAFRSFHCQLAEMSLNFLNLKLEFAMVIEMHQQLWLDHTTTSRTERTNHKAAALCYMVL